MVLTHAEYLQKAKALESSQKPSRRLGVLSSFTAEFLKPYILVESAKIGCLVRPWFAPFNQFEQMILDQRSALWQEKPDVLWITLRIQDVDRYFVDEFPSLTPEQANERLQALRERVVALSRAARDRFTGPILVSTFTLLDQQPADIFDSSDPAGLTYLVAEHNRALAAELATLRDAQFFDFGACISAQGGDRWCDRRLWYLARIAVGQTAMQPLAKSLVRSLAAVVRSPAKCIVIDLDNTIWGGVIGDDGPGGIQLGDDYPGSVFKDFQAALLGYRHRGFLLAVASKNNDALVRDTLDNHPEMILRSKHFAAIEINWDPKPVNLRRIAETLNLGLDTFLFLDDNPVERAEVRAALPMVQVLELPPDPLGYLPALRAVASLDRPRLVSEDLRRADMYQEEARRQECLAKQESMEDFLFGLEMVAEVGTVNPHTLERVHQLIAKTNQFNVTTRRHTLEDIHKFAASPDSEVAWLRLKDRFGASGLVCVGIIQRAGDEAWEIDTFLMSCRVMGRGVEDAFLSYLAELAAARGATRVRGVYVRTSKNNPVATFYADHGFSEVARPDENSRVYEKKLYPEAFVWPAYIQRIDS